MSVKVKYEQIFHYPLRVKQRVHSNLRKGATFLGMATATVGLGIISERLMRSHNPVVALPGALGLIAGAVGGLVSEAFGCALILDTLTGSKMTDKLLDFTRKVAKRVSHSFSP